MIFSMDSFSRVYSACLEMPESNNQSNVEMCIKKRSETETGGLSESTHNCVSNSEESMTVKDAEHSSTSCSGSELMENETSDADLSDTDKQEGTETRQDPCPLCNEIFPSPADYTLHLKKHTDGTQCLVCGKILSSANSLDRHLLVHSGEKPFECQHCGKSFTTNGNMNRHKRKRKHANGSVSDSPEKKAKKVSNNSEISNSTSLNMSKGRMHNCDHCIYGFRSLVKTGLKPENFVLISKMDCERRRTCPFNTKETDKSSDDVKPSQVCDTCGDVCLRISNLHLEENSEELLLCKDCNCGFVSSPRFQLHELSHKMSGQNQVMDTDVRNEKDKDCFLQTLGLFKIKMIENISGRKKTDDSREESVEIEKTVLNPSLNDPNDNSTQVTNASSVVSLSSKSTRNVTSPMSADCASPVSNTVQTPDSPIEGSSVSKECASDNELQCKECGEYFKTKKHLKIHTHQIHLRKKLFRCPQCAYMSTDKSTLTRHIRTHTGERPYMCITCRKKFTTETNAKRHINRKHNISDKPKKYIVCQSSEKSNASERNTRCHYCKKDFGDPKLLTQHKNAPDCPGKPFICSECPMRFPTKNNCLRHMTHQHKLEKDQAREAMIIDKFDPDGKQENDHKLQKSNLSVDAADSEIAPDNDSFMHLESIERENKPEDSLAYTNDKENISTVHEVELNDTAIDMSQNSCKVENEVISTNLNIENVRERPSSTEVDVSYSMLRLWEKLPHQKEQEEALDLSIRPIDLSAKTEKSKPNNTKTHLSISSHFMVPPPAHTSTPIISKQSSHLNLLNYLNKLTLAPIPQPRAGPEIFNLVQNKLMDLPPMSEPQRQNTSCNNNPFISTVEDSNDSERELCIVEDTVSEVSSENGLIPSSSEKPHASDSEINDLASVSSVIDTANSQEINKFLNPVIFNKTHSAKSELGTFSLASKSNVSRNSGDNNKKFPCNQCNKSFDTSSALKRHMVIHTGVKKHKCSTCGKPFGTKSNCKRHELTHLPKNGQKSRDASAEFQNTSDISSNNIDFSNSSMTTDQTDRHDPINELPQNSLGCSFGMGHINPASNILTKFSHLLPGNYCSTQNLECKYCFNSYKDMKDLSNHVKEVHPSLSRH